MPWSNGTFTRAYASWVTDANNNLPISASKFDLEDTDFQNGIQNCLTIDGLNKPTSTLNWAVQINWSRATDGNLWSLARTGGSNNPKLQGSVTDASGITLAVTGGGLAVTSTGLMSFVPATTFAVSSTNFNVAAGGDVTARGAAICKWKPANTSRTTNSQLADPDLTYAIPAAGTFSVRMFLLPSGGAGGILLAPQFSGTSTVAQWTSIGVLNSTGFFGTLRPFGSTAGQGSLAASLDYEVVEGTLIATSAGIVALFWAQFSTNAAATTMQAGSYMTVTQLS